MKLRCNDVVTAMYNSREYFMSDEKAEFITKTITFFNRDL